MCFEFGSCFGGGRRDDYGGERSNRNEAGGRRRGRRGNNSSNGDYAGADQKAAYHNRPPTAVDEAGHKAYHDGAGYAAYTQHKADVGTSKLPGDPAWPGTTRSATTATRGASKNHLLPWITTTTQPPPPLRL